MIANGNPIKENVAMIESTPVCGVAIRKEATAPLDAPSLRIDIAVGITPQEHKGKGMPISAALMTLEKDLRERYLWKYLPGIKVCIIPAMRKPRSR